MVQYNVHGPPEGALWLNCRLRSILFIFRFGSNRSIIKIKYGLLFATETQRNERRESPDISKQAVHIL